MAKSTYPELTGRSFALLTMLIDAIENNKNYKGVLGGSAYAREEAKKMIAENGGRRG